MNWRGWRERVRSAVAGRREEVARKRQTSLPLDEYVEAMPSAQNAIDLVPGWNHALPPQAHAVAGAGKLYSDPRITWALDQFGSIAGLRILELGPLEGSHTYMLDRQRPACIHSIEANKLAFMRCLITKNLLGLNSAQFMLGDFRQWLANSQEKYQLIVASGVLYHMKDPVRLIELMSQRSDALYIWTHFFGEAEMPAGDPRRLAFSGKVAIRPAMGLDVRLHWRSYHEAWRDKSFCGGIYDEHSWLEKDQILSLLKLLGYDDLRTAHERADTPAGPSFSVFARRTHRV